MKLAFAYPRSLDAIRHRTRVRLMDTVGLPSLVRFVKLVRWYLDETYACNADCVGNCSSKILRPAQQRPKRPGDKWARD